jgi:Uma2 family endonuclease
MNAPIIPPEFEIAAHPPAAMPEEPVIPLTVEGYHALIKAGYFLDGDPYELLEGFVVPKMTKGARHESARRRLRRLLEKLISAEYIVDEQGSMTTSDSEPEPDVFVIRGNLDDFADRHAGPEEVALVAEIADSTLTRDRGTKRRIYARAKMPVYWVVNVRDRIVEVFTDPSGPAARPKYRTDEEFHEGDEVPVMIDGKEIGRISVTAILGQAGS